MPPSRGPLCKTLPCRTCLCLADPRGRLNIRLKLQLRHEHRDGLHLNRWGSVAYSPSGNLSRLGAPTTRFIATLASHLRALGELNYTVSGIPRGRPVLRAPENYTRQRPESVENCGDAVELKARSQPRGTCLPARSSDGCDLGSFFAGAGALVSRSPLSARSTNWGLDTIPSALGNEGNEIRTIEQSAIDTIASRVIFLLIDPLPSLRAHTNKRAELLFVPPLRA
jgi:hypothetical protein